MCYPLARCYLPARCYYIAKKGLLGHQFRSISMIRGKVKENCVVTRDFQTIKCREGKAVCLSNALYLVEGCKKDKTLK